MKNIFILFLFFISMISQAQIINIPDIEFKNFLLNYEPVIDINNDNEIQVSEANLVESLSINIGSISSFVGLESFSNLLDLTIGDGNYSSGITLENLLSLESLVIGGFASSTVNLINIPNLNNVYFGYNDNLISLDFDLCNCNNLEQISLVDLHYLPNIDISNFIFLTEFQAHYTPISQIDLSNNINLENFQFTGSYITQLDFSQNVNLQSISLRDMGTVAIDFPINGNLNSFNCTNCIISELDLSQITSLIGLGLEETNIDILNIKNGTTITYLNLFQCNIDYICADDDEIELLEEMTIYGNAVINSYCSFGPGGENYYVYGENSLDVNNDGCDVADVSFPLLKFHVTYVDYEETYFANNSGSYNLLLAAGAHTIIPEVENTDYFNVAPSSIEVDFPADISPFNQDFCVTPNGVYKDMSIAVFSLSNAVPGFEANYRIVYSNTGNSTIDFGQILLTNDYDLMTEGVFNPSWDSFTTADNTWHFNFEDLLPFESRSIDFSMTINTPTDTPAVNDGDVLAFTANYFIEYDEAVPETAFVFNQTVVNSFDPNDKTCLEGNFLDIEKVGEYLHYMIRFENTGTANATNIVVKDELDLTRYDVSSLIPIIASHDFITKVSQGNVVEFIFENINLPFDDANNDGYVVFKVKTLSDLVVDDIIENNAEIYFDFNFPIVTNNEQTTVVEEGLSTNDYVQNNNVRIFPNPTSNIINVKAFNKIDSVKLFDITGKVLRTIEASINHSDAILNLNKLSTGFYFLEVQSGTNKTVIKVLKK